MVNSIRLQPRYVQALYIVQHGVALLVNSNTDKSIIEVFK